MEDDMEGIEYDKARLAKRLVNGVSSETQEYAAAFGVARQADPEERAHLTKKARKAANKTSLPQTVESYYGLRHRGSITKVNLGALLEKALANQEADK